jgi:release factor glutamine methyltransferase
MTTLREALLEARTRIAGTGSDEAPLEAELLLAHALGADRAGVFQRLGEPLADDSAAAFAALVQRRLAGEPVAYILGHKEFFALDFEVTPAAIIPRPETETLVELAAAFAREKLQPGATIVDVGTGCGAIAISLARELPAFDIVAIDISPDALALARRNAARHGLADRIRFVLGDLLDPLDISAHPEPVPGARREPSRRVDLIVANLPYVLSADFEAAPREIREHEPRLGLDGGPDGLSLIARLLREAPPRLRHGGALFAEIGETQGPAARELAAAAFPSARIEVHSDLSALDRVLAVLT